jgi:branched-chain amino acid transport system substrate-binding protein
MNGPRSPRRSRIGKWLGAAAFALLTSFAGDTPSTSAPHSEIVLGMSTALSGPAADLGNKMLEGVNAALAEVERAGGLHGRRVRLIALDDGYEPERTGPNIRKLVEQEHVVAIVGDVGTPTAVVALQITNPNRTPFFGAFSGAGLLRKSPPERYVVNYRASYEEEILAMVDALIDRAGIRCSQIAFFTQRDAYGDSGFAGGVRALRSHGLKDESSVLHVRYERNTVSIDEALAGVLLAKEPPRAVIMVGAYKPCAAFIERARANGLDPFFLNVSFVSSSSLLRELGDKGDGVIITQVVPHFDDDLPIVKQYRAALAESAEGSTPGFISLEGYISTRILCRALAAIDGAPDRESVANALEGLGAFDVGLGEPMNLSADQHQACHRVWPTIIRGQEIVPFDWASLGRNQ